MRRSQPSHPHGIVRERACLRLPRGNAKHHSRMLPSTEPENAFAEMGDQPKADRLIPVGERPAERQLTRLKPKDNASPGRESRQIVEQVRSARRNLDGTEEREHGKL